MDFQSIVSRVAHLSSFTPAPLPTERWWETLSPTFSREREAFELGASDKLKVRVTATGDVVLRSLGASLLGALAFPLGYGPRKFAEALKDAEFYGPLAETQDPHRFFKKPKVRVRMRVTEARRPLFAPKDGVCEDLSFESPFQAVNPRLRLELNAHRNNSRAHARCWRHLDGTPRPTIIAIHGFSADLYHLNEWFFALPWFYKRGCDVVLFTLPFHGKRQGRTSPFSGHGFFAGGVPRINEAVAQAVYDLRLLIDWLEHERGVEKVGVTGVSLGGFTSAALATVEKRLQFAIPNVPVASFPDLMLEWEPLGSLMRASLAYHRASLVDARYMLAASSPLSYAPALSRDRLFIVGGIGDRLAPPKHSRLLWEHWQRCRIHWFPGSHLVHLDRGSYLSQIDTFLRGIEFFSGHTEASTPHLRLVRQ